MQTPFNFRLDQKFLRNASKFAIFHAYKNPKLLFPIFISCYQPYFFHNESHGIVLYCQLTYTWSFVRKKNKVASNGRVSLELFVKQTFWFWGYWAYCSLDTFFCANILICYIMQKQIHSTYLYKLFYLKWQLGLLDIENKEIIWYEFVKPNWNLFENFPKLIRIAEKKKKIK